MIRTKEQLFELHTGNTSYLFRLMETGHLEHLHYGGRIETFNADRALSQKVAMLGGNGISYSPMHPLVGLEDLCLEFSSFGHGDVRDPFVDITYENGSRTSDFLYEKHWICRGKTAMKTLPSAYDGAEPGRDAEDDGIEELHILLKDRYYSVEMELIYAVFPKTDVITRRAVLRNLNEAKAPIVVNRLMSTQLDLPDARFCFHTFAGHWAREMNRQMIPLKQGKWVSESRCGISSSMNNPFVMLSRPETSETAGECYAFNLIYSGNHYEAAEVSGYGKTRITAGIHPEGFSFELAPGEEFEAPEAVMTFSDGGFQGISRHMHDFVRRHIVRGTWKYSERPILLNSWEAVYFDFDEDRLLEMAKRAKDAGIELFVMDDGWFGGRNDARSSLGDWFVNTGKLPQGISGLAKKIEAMGMRFGLWVEPEMISVKSRLHEEHPDWAVEVPGTGHSEGRFQRILDLTRKDVRSWLVDTMSEVFGQEGVSYVKWDNNRIFTDVFGRELKNQTEYLHRYYMGYYEVMGELVRRFPHILFEGCASGGNRFDLGVLCYMPQIWASDNTDALCRAEIQTGLSYGYPMSVVSAHVSACPNHQTGRITPWSTRFGVAAFGVLGYECNLAQLTDNELEEVKAQISFYKKYRKTLQYGDYHRLDSRRDDFVKGLRQWMTTAPDKSCAIGFSMTEQVVPNMSFEVFRTAGLNDCRPYSFKDWNYETEGSEENIQVYGSLLNRAGIKLAQAYSDNGRHPGARRIWDNHSRIYVMEAADASED